MKSLRVGKESILEVESEREEVIQMPRRGGGGHQHTAKADRMAEEIAEEAKKEGRYKGREEEVAWRTVHKDLPKKEREK